MQWGFHHGLLALPVPQIFRLDFVMRVGHPYSSRSSKAKAIATSWV